MKKLKEYIHRRKADLEEKEKAQKVLRTWHSYSLLPRLPIDVILRILFCIASRSSISIDNSESLTVYIYGLLPHFIFKPDLIMAHCCDRVDMSGYTLQRFATATIKPSILEDVDLSKSMFLQVRVMEWPISPVCDGIFRSLIQIPKRWRDLHVQFNLKSAAFGNILQLLNSCKSCVPYLETLDISLPRSLDSMSLNQAVTVSTAERFTSGSLKTASLSSSIFPTLFKYGILDTITSLSLYHDYHNPGRNSVRDVALDSLPHVLSNMPCLRSLTTSIPLYENFVNLPKVESRSLHHLTISDDADYEHLVAFFALFSDCSINFFAMHTEKSILEKLSEFFPGLKTLIYVSSIIV